jgi:hypothetical protein
MDDYHADQLRRLKDFVKSEGRAMCVYFKTSAGEGTCRKSGVTSENRVMCGSPSPTGLRSGRCDDT